MRNASSFFLAVIMTPVLAGAASPDSPIEEGTISLESTKDVRKADVIVAEDGSINAVVEGSTGLDFLDESGKKRATVPWSQAYGDGTINETSYSQNRKFVLLHALSNAERLGKDDTITTYDSSGRKLWSAKAAYGTHFIAPNGQYAVVLAPNTITPHEPPAFIGPDGLMNKAIYNSKFATSDKWYPKLSTTLLAFSADSARVAVGLSSYVDPGAGKVAIFSSKGELETVLGTKINPQAIAFSPDGMKLVVEGTAYHADDSQVQQWDVASTTLMWESKVPVGQYQLAVTADSRAVLAASMRTDDLIRFDGSSGKRAWKLKSGESADFAYKSLSVVGDAIVASGEDRHGETGIAAILVARQDGQVAQKKTFKKGEIVNHGDRHAVVCTDRTIAVVTPKGIRKLELKKKP